MRNEELDATDRLVSEQRTAEIERLRRELAECHAAMERAAVLIAAWTSSCDYRAEADLREAWKVLCAVRK